jgi:ubiquinone/menaquinone biosynthesis C-methylase UbiE
MVYDAIKTYRFSKLLEVGTGSGIFLPTLSTLSDKIVATDIHPNLDKVEAMITKEELYCDVEFKNVDIQKMPFKKDSFGGVISISTMEHIQKLDQAFDEVHKVLKKDGLFVIGIPAANLVTRMGFILLGEGEVIDDHHCNTHKDIFKSLKKHFEIVETKRFWFPTLWPIYYVIVAKNIK